MIIDVHVHIAACTPGHGSLSRKLLGTVPFRFMQWKFGFRGASAATEEALRNELVRTIEQTPEIDKAVVLAFDAVHDEEGNFNAEDTHLYVTNDYVMEIVARHPRTLFGASVHPYRKDALAELERCIRGGAVLLKWLPMVQGFNPADARCIPFYEMLAHYKLPLLSHTGAENSLPVLDYSTADPKLLIPALKRGVRVIAAHCGTRLWPSEPDYLPDFVRMAKEYEHLYGDTAALNLPMRWRGYDVMFEDEVVRGKIVHGSDWPIVPVPRFGKLGASDSLELLAEPNWLKRDVLIKRRLGFDEAYWQRAGGLLRMPA